MALAKLTIKENKMYFEIEFSVPKDEFEDFIAEFEGEGLKFTQEELAEKVREALEMIGDSAENHFRDVLVDQNNYEIARNIKL